MSENTDFLSLLQVSLGDVKKPLPIPVGFYQFEIAKYSFSAQETKSGIMNKLTLMCRPVACVDDSIEADNLPEGWNKKVIFKDFILDENRLHQLSDFFMKTLGIEDHALSMAEIVTTLLVKQQFVGELQHRTFKNKAGEQDVIEEIGSTSRID